MKTVSLETDTVLPANDRSGGAPPVETVAAEAT